MNKNLIIIFIITLMHNYLCSQEFLEFPNDSFIWVTEFHTYYVVEPGWITTERYYVLKGDTIIDSKVYGKVYTTTIDANGAKIEDNELFGFLRSNDGVVSFYDNIEEFTLYDFNLTIEDTFDLKIEYKPSVNNGKMKLIDIDTIDYYGDITRKFVFEEINGGWGLGDHIWIEGIGSEEHGFFYPELASVDQTAYLVCGSTINEHNCDIPMNINIISDDKNANIKIVQSGNSIKFWFDNQHNKHLELIDMQGRLINKKSSINKEIDLDINIIPNGTYIIRIISDQIVICNILIKH